MPSFGPVSSHPVSALPQGAVTYTFAGSGGIVFAGSAGRCRTKANAGSGGITFGGTAPHCRTRAKAGSGGIVFGGAATCLKILNRTGSGGITFGGAATTQFVSAAHPGYVFRQLVLPPRPPRLYRYVGRGGIVFGGAGLVGFSTERRFVGSGGLRHFSGAAQVARSKARRGAGGIVFGGAAVAELVESPWVKIRQEEDLALIGDPDADLALVEVFSDEPARTTHSVRNRVPSAPPQPQGQARRQGRGPADDRGLRRGVLLRG